MFSTLSNLRALVLTPSESWFMFFTMGNLRALVADALGAQVYVFHSGQSESPNINNPVPTVTLAALHSGQSQSPGSWLPQSHSQCFLLGQFQSQSVGAWALPFTLGNLRALVAGTLKVLVHVSTLFNWRTLL